MARPSELLSARQMGKHLGLAARTVTRMRKQGKIPFKQIGLKTFRYRAEDVEAALVEAAEEREKTRKRKRSFAGPPE